jgi:hypothetical protein
LRIERAREFGSVFLALALWRRLGLHELLGELIESGREEIAWADVAAVLTVGKFCGQASELGIAENWYARTALEDLCGIPTGSVNDDRLYRALDKVGAHKDRLSETYPLATPGGQLKQAAYVAALRRPNRCANC